MAKLSTVLVLGLSAIAASAVPLEKRISQTISDSTQQWVQACNKAGGNEQCSNISVTAFSTLLAAAGPCDQQDSADAMIDLAKQLNNDPDMIKFAQIFAQQPRNTPTSESVQYCQEAPKNAELNGLFQCQFQGAKPDTFVGGVKVGSPETVPFGLGSPLSPPGACPANPEGPIADGQQLVSITQDPGLANIQNGSVSSVPPTEPSSVAPSASGTVSVSSSAVSSIEPTAPVEPTASVEPTSPVATSALPSESISAVPSASAVSSSAETSATSSVASSSIAAPASSSTSSCAAAKKKRAQKKRLASPVRAVKRIAQDTTAAATPWEDACTTAGGADKCNTIAVAAFGTLLAAADACAQQDSADAMIDLAKTLNNDPDMIKLAQIFAQQPRNTPTSQAVPYCQKAPKNAELDGLFQCQFQSADEQTFVGGLAAGSPGTIPFGQSAPVSPPGACPASPAGPIPDGQQLLDFIQEISASATASAPVASSTVAPGDNDEECADD